MNGTMSASWLVRLDGHPELNTDQLTLDEVDVFERVSGTPWPLLNPWKRVRDASALILVVAMRSGDTEEQAKARLRGVVMGDIRGAFQPVFDDRAPARRDDGDGGGDDDPPPSAPTSAAG